MQLNTQKRIIYFLCWLFPCFSADVKTHIWKRKTLSNSINLIQWQLLQYTVTSPCVVHSKLTRLLYPCNETKECHGSMTVIIPQPRNRQEKEKYSFDTPSSWMTLLIMLISSYKWPVNNVTTLVYVRWRSGLVYYQAFHFCQTLPWPQKGCQEVFSWTWSFLKYSEFPRVTVLSAAASTCISGGRQFTAIIWKSR